MTPNILRILATVAAAQAALAAAADDWWTGAISFSGYGTFGVVRSSERNADYLVDAFKPTGPGFTHEWSPDVESPRRTGHAQTRAEAHRSGAGRGAAALRR